MRHYTRYIKSTQSSRLLVILYTVILIFRMFRLEYFMVDSASLSILMRIWLFHQVEFVIWQRLVRSQDAITEKTVLTKNSI